MVELVDTLVSEASARMGLGVQVPLFAPISEHVEKIDWPFLKAPLCRDCRRNYIDILFSSGFIAAFCLSRPNHRNHLQLRFHRTRRRFGLGWFTPGSLG